jgi:hypothetical protein
MEVTVNILELASNLAHDRTFYESGDICNNEDDMFEDIDAEILTYKEEIQDRFNEWYDYYYDEIYKCYIKESTPTPNDNSIQLKLNL